jgi:chloramphenicol 3-O-phosphotransferase
VIVLNGGSSSGKSGIARCLQAILPDPWLAFGTDNLIQAMPTSLQTSGAGIEFGQDIIYDLQVDTTHSEALPCAQAIAAHAR